MTTSFKIVLHGLLFPLALPLLLACGDSQTGVQTRSIESPDLVQWYLPKQLREVSGLALVNATEVLAIQDERAEVFRLNILTGEVISSFTLGKPAVKGDFEGVAVHQQQVYLLTSNGQLYKANLNTKGTSLPYETFELGLAKDCELEGLAYEPGSDLLWLVCKQVHRQADANTLRLHAWSTATQTLKPELTKQLPLILDKQRGKLNPSGLAFTQDGQRLLIIAARQASYAWYAWSDNPKLTTLEKLPEQGKHRQAEGVAITSQGLLLIADEGKKRSGILSRYSALFN